MIKPMCSVTFADGNPCPRPRLYKYWCKPCYGWSLRNGGANPDGRQPRRSRGQVQAILADAANATTDDCIYLTGYKHRPKTEIDGKQMLASRAVWIIGHAGEDPGEDHVLHTCHNGEEGCINIRHLYLGDNTQNRRDSIDAGRQARGERCGLSKLTQPEVDHIKELAAQGMTYGAIANRFGRPRSTVYNIVIGRTWRD